MLAQRYVRHAPKIRSDASWRVIWLIQFRDNTGQVQWDANGYWAFPMHANLTSPHRTSAHTCQVPEDCSRCGRHEACVWVCMSAPYILPAKSRLHTNAHLHTCVLVYVVEYMIRSDTLCVRTNERTDRCNAAGGGHSLEGTVELVYRARVVDRHRDRGSVAPQDPKLCANWLSEYYVQYAAASCSGLLR